MADTTFLAPDNSVPMGVLPYLNNNGGLFGGNGTLGSGVIGFILGALCNGGFGGGGLFGGGNNGNHNADLIMQAVTNSGERSVSAVQQLSTNLNMDFNLLNGAVQTVSQGINQIANAQGLNAMQIVNQLQSGNAAIQNQLSQCCCQMQSTLTTQANMLQQGANQNTQSILGELRAMQTQALQDKLDAERAKNTQLAGEISQANQNNAIAAMIANAVNPLAAQLAGIRGEVDAIKRCQPSTITLPNNSMTAVPTIWANGVADLVVDRVAAALAQTGETGTTTPTTSAAVARM